MNINSKTFLIELIGIFSKCFVDFFENLNEIETIFAEWRENVRCQTTKNDSFPFFDLIFRSMAKSLSQSNETKSIGSSSFSFLNENENENQSRKTQNVFFLLVNGNENQRSRVIENQIQWKKKFVVNRNFPDTTSIFWIDRINVENEQRRRCVVTNFNDRT